MLGKIRTSDCQEEEDENGSSTTLSEQRSSGSGGGKTSRDVSGSEDLHVGITPEGDSSETEGGGEGEGDGEPCKTTKKVSLDGGSGPGSDSTLPISW